MNGQLPLLLVARGDQASWRYATGMEIEDALYFDFGAGDQLLIVPELELDRARLQARAKTITDRRAAGYVEGSNSMRQWAELAARILGERGVEAVRISRQMPVGYYELLRSTGVEMAIDHDLFRQQRRKKTPEEASFIHAAQRAAEAACAEVIQHIAVAEIRDGLLWLDGRPLTSERLMARAEAALQEIGYSGADMIVAGSPESALPHYRGEGQLRAGLPIIIDIFPRGKTSGYHGDLTRTVVAGEVPADVQRMFDATVHACEVAIAAVRPGVNGRDVHEAACQALVEAGFGTIWPGFEGRGEGPVMNHSTGHGVGLEAHEEPLLRPTDYPLAPGDVITVEPGLYQVGLGGVRVEDTGLVTPEGFKNFTSLPKSLNPRAYL
ncbi:MAG TPA: Xaa-Pro peptidase family protein [Candidatus Dormibacteraeota bacterium]